MQRRLLFNVNSDGGHAACSWLCPKALAIFGPARKPHEDRLLADADNPRDDDGLDAAQLWSQAGGEPVRGGGCDDEDTDPSAPVPTPPQVASLRRSGSSGAAQDLLLLTQCIQAITKRDERALQALYVVSAQRVYASVLRVVRQAALAEEVVMDTYFQVWRQAGLYDAGRGQVLAWVLAIARSRALDALRRQARFQYQPLDDDATADERAWLPSDDLQDSRSHALLHGALMALQAQPRQLVALAYFRGLTHEEIATQTQLPLGTVKSQLRRALFSLHQTLRPAFGHSAGAPPV